MKVHFIAIGGSVMHNLALSLRQKGYIVSGSDDEIFEPALSLLSVAGILPERIGWYPEKITPDIDAVILGMHARADNPELIRAKELGLKIFSFPAFVANQSQNKKRIVIGGSHGKTTTTSMLMHVLKYLGKDFDYLVGSRVEGFDLTVKLTPDAPIIVIEGDEYLSSALERVPKFHLYKPHIGLLTGIAWDHINVFPTFENYVAQFALFVETFPDGATLVYNLEDETLRQIALFSKTSVQKVPYATPSYSIQEGKTKLIFEGKMYPLEIFGRHNLQNLEGARQVCLQLGISSEQFMEAIASFKGAAKRLELVARNERTTIYKDFAHSPSKLKATIEAVKEQFPEKRLVSVMELHTFSSLNKKFLKEYAGTMDASDEAIIYFNKHTLEHKQLPDVSVQEVREAFKNKRVQVFNDKETMLDMLYSQPWQNANLLMMSSGNFDGLDWQELSDKVVSDN
ncbi:MAG: Mur ligase family protein [Chitinophagales bacterium]|nr:Mur ligase family protein [Chitinophagales bacterium]